MKLRVFVGSSTEGMYVADAIRLEPRQGDAENSGVEPGDARQVREWLTTGLIEQGAGAKTAAGYGYFESPEESGRERAGNHRSPAPRTAPGGRATWRQATLLWKKNESVLESSGFEASFIPSHFRHFGTGVTAGTASEGSAMSYDPPSEPKGGGETLRKGPQKGGNGKWPCKRLQAKGFQNQESEKP